MKYVCYYRVSTKGQGKSGLGLGDQMEIVQRFLREGDVILEEHTEVESGRKSNRPKIQEAIRACQKFGAKLLIAKLDRLSRNVAFVMTLRDSGVDFVACDLPDANTLTVGIMVTFAQHEAERGSERTKAALAQKKAQGFKLGKPENLTKIAIEKGREIRVRNAKNHKANVQATELSMLYRNMGMTYAAIAEKLNLSQYLTRRKKRFDGKAVYRLLKRA
ncbi:recombinase family protein [Runella salmonicolor]|uniref:Recombinase family protein n=1 Tax=Runella salmonicolor TaxID=2950278 RepID=A0ABT1FXX6_9BACT|nr:recombinase family protein [Runella salmonicolor]MCP1386561.1 recombinase family protein [Runella salmonicolor]